MATVTFHVEFDLAGFVSGIPLNAFSIESVENMPNGNVVYAYVVKSAYASAFERALDSNDNVVRFWNVPPVEHTPPTGML